MKFFQKLKALIERLIKKNEQGVFSHLPYKRVVNYHEGNQEIFGLYPLGVFSAPDSFLKPLSSCQEEEEVEENIELVELTALSSYKPHYHKKSAAVIYIILGDGDFLVGKEIIKYKSGTRVVIPAGVKHGFNTKTKTFFLSIQTPSIINQNQEIDLYYE